MSSFKNAIGKISIEYFFQKLKRAYADYDCSSIIDLLADNFIYESFFEFNKTITKQGYIKFLTNKLQDMKDVGYKERLEHLYESDTGEQILVFPNKPIPQQGGEYVCLVASSDRNGKIDKLTLTLTSFYTGLFMPKGALEELLSM